jgi:hypothetical protein
MKTAAILTAAIKTWAPGEADIQLDLISTYDNIQSSTSLIACAKDR